MSEFPEVLKGVVLNAIEQGLIRDSGKFIGGIHHAPNRYGHIGSGGCAHFGFECGVDGHDVAGACFEVVFGDEFYRAIAFEELVIQGDGVVAFFFHGDVFFGREGVEGVGEVESEG